MTVQNVTAKFYVESILLRGYGGNKTAAEISMRPIYEEKGPNKSWSEATPAGELKMTITNKAAFEYFELGRVYLMTFEKESPPEV